MVTIGVEGQRIKKQAVVRAALLAAGAARQAVEPALTGAKSEPTWFEPVFTVSMAALPAARAEDLPGPWHRVPDHPRAHAGHARPGYVVGSVGPVTAQQLQELGPPYSAAELVGQTGLERAYQKQLAGQPGATVTAVNAAGAPSALSPHSAPRRARRCEPASTRSSSAPQRKRWTACTRSAALVAVNAATGQVLAAVSVPAGSGFNLALDGAFPPGSSFKVLTTTALIEHGLAPSSPASCPPQLTVDGEVFHNAEGTGPASDLLRAFAESCNTAFIGLATRHLTAADFTRTAALYRLGTAPQLGLPAFAGSVPKPSDEADLAATTIGQGQVLVSPLDMAMVAAAVDTGQVARPGWWPARLTTAFRRRRCLPMSSPTCTS